MALIADASEVAVLIDLSDQLCPVEGNTCPPLIEGEITWRTKYLLTATFAASMMGALERQLFGNPEGGTEH